MRYGSRLVLLATTLVALLALAPGLARSDGTLVATVGPGFDISLTGADGQPVTRLPAGTYTITVHDQSNIHDFHLSGPGVDQTTDIDGTGDTTWTVTLQDGTYTFVCDAHATTMKGSFSVGAQPPAAVPVKLHATLTAGAEVPKQTVKAPNGTGAFSGTVSAGKLSWKLTFAHLSGRAVAAHIHTGRAGKSGAVVIPLCAPCRSGAHGTITLKPAQLALVLRSGASYVNVHTQKNPNGEIRGQLVRQSS
jgi:hypothetical protein